MTNRPLSPDEKKEYGYKAGKGLYSAFQLKNIVFPEIETSDGDENKIVVKIPKERLQAVKKADSIVDTLAPIISGYRGFQEKREDYMTKQKTELKRQLDEAEKEYMTHLMHSKKAEIEKKSTPHVDALCLGMLKEIEKDAEDKSVSHGAMLRTLGHLVSPITKHLPSKQKIKDTLITNPTLLSTALLWNAKSMLRDTPKTPYKHPLDVEVEAV